MSGEIKGVREKGSMRTLALDPRSIIVLMKTGLRVYSMQGTVELRSTNLARVHEILQGRLTGQYTERALISAVPVAQRMTVRRYLRALRDAGAIQIGKNSTAQYSMQPMGKEAQSHLLIRPSQAGNDDQHQGSKQASLQYITWRELSSLLVRKIDTRAAAKRQIYVLTDESWTVESGSEGCHRQALYSRWLLSGDFSHLEKPKIEIFQIDKNTGALTRKAMLAGKRLAINLEVPKALELVHATDIEQAPLAVCQANSMLCPMELRWFGVDYDRVADEVLRDTLMRMTIESADAISQIRWRRMSIADMASESTLQRVVRTDDCLVAASLGELRLRLVERFLSQTQGTVVHAERCDLLQSWSSSDLDYLAQVLRQRHSCLEAEVTTRADGLYQCAHGDLCTTSLLKHKALRDLMILLTWRTYYGQHDDAAYRPAHECDYSLIAKPLQLRKVFSGTTEQLGVEIVGKHLIFAKISCWGKSAWVGTLDE
jgi:hypothetical protein